MPPLTIRLDDPRFVALCQHCGTQHDHLQAMQPWYCRIAEVSYHDTADPCLVGSPAAKGHPIVGLVLDGVRSRRALLAENALLRQQLILLRRQ